MDLNNSNTETLSLGIQSLLLSENDEEGMSWLTSKRDSSFRFQHESILSFGELIGFLGSQKVPTKLLAKGWKAIMKPQSPLLKNNPWCSLRADM